MGRFYGMLHLSAKRHRFIVWWEDALWKTFWATISRTYYSIWFIGWVLPYNCIGPVPNSINLERKSYVDCSSDMLCTREGIGGWRTGLRPLRSWRRWTHRKSTRKDSMWKRWYNPNKENLFCQSQMDESKPLQEIRNWEHPPWYGRDQFKERVTLTFLEKQKGLFHNLKTHFRMLVKR